MLQNNYNLLAEYIVLFFAFLTLILMLLTKPKKTRLFGICQRGLVLSIVTSICQMILFFGGQSVEMYGKGYLETICLIFNFLYGFTTIYMFTYVYFYATNDNRKRLNSYYIKASLVCLVYVVIAFYLLSSGKMIVLTDQGVQFKLFIVFYACIGIICNASIIVVALIKRNRIPRNVLRGVLIYEPINLIILVAQMFDTNIIFSSATFVTPFIMFYVLFHSIPYKEIGGCQGQESLEARCIDNNRHNRRYTMVLLYFPQIKNLEITSGSEFINVIADEMCKKFEQLDRKLYNYRINKSAYVICIQKSDEQKIQELVYNMEAIIKEYLKRAPFYMYYKMIAIDNKHKLQDVSIMNELFEYLIEKYGKGSNSLCYMTTYEDVVDFLETHKLQQLLLSIRNHMDLDDEHVLCYAQPIYRVQNKAFRTAEALMRLQMDDKIIYPDKFISLAEKNNCMHALTCIMTNKVCKRVRELQDDYSFDAITINCSAVELGDNNFCQDILTLRELLNVHLIQLKSIRAYFTKR